MVAMRRSSCKDGTTDARRDWAVAWESGRWPPLGRLVESANVVRLCRLAEGFGLATSDCSGGVDILPARVEGEAVSDTDDGLRGMFS